MDYKKAYALLVGVVSSAIDEMSKSQFISREMENVVQILRDGLEDAKEMYISSGT